MSLRSLRTINLQSSLSKRTFLILFFEEFPVDQEIHCFI